MSRFVFNPLTGKLDLVGDEAPVVSQAFETEILTIPSLEARASLELNVRSAKYFVACYGPTEASSFEMNVLKVASETRDSVSNKLGKLNIQVSSILTAGGNIRIEIFNSESFAIEARIIYSRG